MSNVVSSYPGTTSRSLKARLEAGEILVLDGANGTLMMQYGFRGECAPELWAAEHADVMAGIHAAYIAAGADVILTNTIGGSAPKLARYGLGDETSRLNRRLAEIAVQTAGVAERPVIVLGDVGATGELMAPAGTLSEAEMIAAHTPQIEGLLEGGVAGIFVETMLDVAEAVAAIKAARRLTALPVLASLAFDPGRRGPRTLMGQTPAQAAVALLEAGALVVGANCGSLVAAQMPAIVAEMRAAGARWVAVEPNAGLPVMADGQTVFPQSPEEMAASVPAILEAGARLIGGCCGTTPEHIRLIAQAVRRHATGAR